MSGASWKIWGITYLVTQTNYIVHISVAPYHVSVPFEVRVVLNFQFYFIIIAGKWEVSSCLPLHIPVPVLCLLLLAACAVHNRFHPVQLHQIVLDRFVPGTGIGSVAVISGVRRENLQRKPCLLYVP